MHAAYTIVAVDKRYENLTRSAHASFGYSFVPFVCVVFFQFAFYLFIFVEFEFVMRRQRPVSSALVVCAGAMIVTFVSGTSTAGSSVGRPPPTIVDRRPELHVNATGSFDLSCEARHPVRWSYPKLEHGPRDDSSSYITTVTADDRDRVSRTDVHVTSASYADTGFYTCHYFDATDVADPTTTSSTYVYVHDDLHPLAYTDDAYAYPSYANETFTVPCKPTSPTSFVIVQTPTGQIVDSTFESRGFAYDPRLGFSASDDGATPVDGTYTCKALDADVSETRRIAVRRAEPSGAVIEDDDDEDGGGDVTVTVAAVGDDFVFECRSVGVPTPRTIWTKDAAPLDTSTRAVFTDNNRRMSLTDVDEDDGGVYRCVAFNGFGRDDRTVVLSVRVSETSTPEISTRDTSTSDISTSEIATPAYDDDDDDDVGTRPATIVSSNIGNDTTLYATFAGSLDVFCRVDGAPTPAVAWKKDGETLRGARIVFGDNNQTVHVSSADVDDGGVYSCAASNGRGDDERTGRVYVVVPALQVDMLYVWIGGGALAGLFFVAVVACAICSARKRKTARNCALLVSNERFFEEGNVKSLDKHLTVHSQAIFLPCDRHWTLPRKKLQHVRRLGDGRFHSVMTATASDISEDEPTTTVALKTIRHDLYFESFASQVKIMAHVGKHVNLVNMLGVCTEKISKRKLYAVVEYCEYGNLHDYLSTHGHWFVDHINPGSSRRSFPDGAERGDVSDTRKKRDKTNRTNRMSRMSTASGAYVNVQRKGKLALPMTEPTSGTCPRCRRGARTFDNHPTCTTDLLSWAHQVSCGMEYLASRNVLHGDLALRNVLLAANNVVKLNDFGLSHNTRNQCFRTEQRVSSYKYMAVESLRDRIFSTQSDVWAYGVVLWELFALATPPYPDVSTYETLYFGIHAGRRLERPVHSSDEIYEVMLACWDSNPNRRPSFDELSNYFGRLLDNDTKKNIAKLNTYYQILNELQKNTENYVDHLATMRPPSYDNMKSGAASSADTCGGSIDDDSIYFLPTGARNK